jgi:hypothetical protein
MEEVTCARDGPKPEQRLLARVKVKPRLHFRAVEQPPPGLGICFSGRLCFQLVKMTLGAVQPRRDCDAPALVLLVRQLLELRQSGGALRLCRPYF